VSEFNADCTGSMSDASK